MITVVGKKRSNLLAADGRKEVEKNASYISAVTVRSILFGSYHGEASVLGILILFQVVSPVVVVAPAY